MLLSFLKKIHLDLFIIFCTLLFLDISLFFVAINLNLDFFIFIIAGMIMFYGGIMGLGNTSPTIYKLGTILKMNSAKALTEKKIKIATQNSIYYFLLGVYLLLLSSWFSSLIRLIFLFLTNIFN